MTLDRDVERMLKEEMHRNKTSFKKALNSAVRKGLDATPKGNRKKFVVHARNLGLRPEFEGISLTRVLEELDAEAYLEKTRRLEGK